MMTATCRGRRLRSSFSNRSASSGVNGPSAPEAETCSVVCDLVGGTGFLKFLLYAAKLTYDLAVAQCRGDVSSIPFSRTTVPRVSLPPEELLGRAKYKPIRGSG